MSLVSFARIENEDGMKSAIRQSLELIEYKFPEKTQEVVIKPNLCYYWDWTTGQTTDPKFVGALIALIREEVSPNVHISIVESDASAMRCKYAFKMLGYEQLSKQYDADLINLCEDKGEEVEVTVRNEPYRFVLPKTIRDADLTINVPKIKYTFERIKLTCALKNIFGCNPYQKKFKYHSRIEEVIVALNKAMGFDLCIVDGYIVSGVKPQRLGLVMSSRDPVAIDSAAAKIAGVNQNGVRYIALAEKEGLGRANFVTCGIPISHFVAMYPRGTIRTKVMTKGYTMVVRLGLNRRLGLA